MKQLIGKVINNFEIQEVIGQGGMGIVLRAYHPDLQRYAAVKIMRPELASQPGFFERFLQEARAAAHLDHPGIVDVINFGRYENSFYLMMDFVEGPTLRQLINENPGGMSLWDVAQIFIQIAEALSFAHQRGILHRDMKPDNILLTESIKPNRPYRAIVTDFGLVKLAEHSLLQTQQGISIGTPAYMSPEQCRGEDVDGRTDLYAVGVMIYESVTGKRPYPVRNLFDAARFHSSGQIISIRAHNQSVPPALDLLVKRLLTPDMNRRPATAMEVAETLQTVIDSLQTESSGAKSAVQTRIDQVLQQLIEATPLDKISPVAGSASPAPSTAPEPSAAPALSAAPVPSAAPATSPAPPPVAPLAVASAAKFYIEVYYHEELEGQPYPLAENKPLFVGRTTESDIALTRPERYVSKRHCEIILQGGRVLLRDLGSTNGTFLSEARLLRDNFYPWPVGTPVQLGPFTLALKKVEAKPAAPPSPPTVPEPPVDDNVTARATLSEMIICTESDPPRLPLTDRPLIIGRAADADMVLHFAQVSKHHCRIQRNGSQVEIVDLGSTNGTFLDGRRLAAQTPTVWQPENALKIGPGTFMLMRSGA